MIKRYIHKVYRHGQFVGSFKGDLVANEFGYNQNINTAGAQITIELAASFADVGAVASETKLVDEDGNFIVDENGFNILVSKTYVFNNIPIDPGNEVQTYVFDDDAPNGLKVFTGFISTFKSNARNERIVLTILSYGVQLDNYMLTSDPTSQTISQIVYDKEYTLTPIGYGTANGVAQTFNLPSPAEVASFTIYARSSQGPFETGKDGETITPVASTRWQLYSGTPTSLGALVDSGNIAITGTQLQQITLALSSTKTLSGDYTLWMYNNGGGSYYYASTILKATNTNPYAGGSVYTATDATSPSWSAVAADDLAFVVNSSSGSSSLAFLNTDPAGIITRVLDQYIAQGGRITYTSDSIATTGTTTNYIFKVSTILEAINSIITLSPAGTYWYVDPATNIFYFNRPSTSADHKFTKGIEVEDLDLEYTIENVRNAAVFSGGDDGSGDNVYIIDSNTGSKAAYDQWLEKLSNNRVTDVSDAQVIVSNFLNTHAEPSWRTEITIRDGLYDIESLSLGEMVGFQNYNDLTDDLLLQIVSKRVSPYSVTLALGVLPPIASSAYDELSRRLDAQETVNNPETPS